MKQFHENGLLGTNIITHWMLLTGVILFQSQVSHDPKQQAKAKKKGSATFPRKDYDWLDTEF